MYPMVSDRLRRNILAAWLGVYPISLAVFSTSVRVFLDTSGYPSSALETVVMDNPSFFAISRIVIIFPKRFGKIIPNKSLKINIASIYRNALI